MRADKETDKQPRDTNIAILRSPPEGIVMDKTESYENLYFTRINNPVAKQAEKIIT